MTFESKFSFGDSVNIDRDLSIVATVVGFMFTTLGCSCELAWFANGEQKTAWVLEWRLSAVEPSRPTRVGLP